MTGRLHRFIHTLFLSFFIVFSTQTAVLAQSKDKDPKKEEGKKADADSTSKDDKKTYRELLKKAESKDGLFTVHRVDKDFYFELPLTRMDRDILLVNKISSVPLIINEAGINKGMNTDNKVIRFSLNKRIGSVWVKTIVPQVESPAGDAITRSVNDNFTGSVIESFKVEAYNADSSAVLIKVNKVFDGSEKSFNDIFNDIGLGTSAKTALSAIEEIKAFPENLVVKSILTTSVTEERATAPVSVSVTTNILLLPEKPMTPRYADNRIGFFSAPRWYFSDAQHQMEKRQLITRWRLEPKPADRERYKKGELVEPAKPIIFYLDPATPPQWKPYIKAGIIEWQKAFEEAGFKNAIQAREVTDTTDFDVDDVRYSVVTYAASPKSNAMGPAVIDPRSGEILESDVIWWHNVMTSLKYWMRIQTGTIDSAARAHTLSNELMGNAIRFVSSHEIGHTLGLKHNMASSAAFPVDSLRSPSFTERMGGTASSIMDYARFNYVAQPEDGVKYSYPAIGIYDKYAIAWGYRWLDEHDPEREVSTLRSWIRKHENDPLYAYGEQQADIVDPRAQSEDLGDDNVKASIYGMKNLERLIPQISSWVTKEGEDYYEAGKLYMAALSQWHTYSGHVIANIGGLYLERPVMGDGKRAYTPVPSERQRSALNYLKSTVLNVPGWLFNDELLRKTFPVKDSPLGPFEYGPYNTRRNFQYDLIYQLISDERLMRLVESEGMTKEKDGFTASELLREISATVFAPTLKGRSLSLDGRMAQQNFVDALLISTNKLLAKLREKSIQETGLAAAHERCDYMLGNTKDIFSTKEHELRNIHVSSMARTSEAAILKRGELLRILDILGKKRNTGDDITRAHYNDLILRIKQSLQIN